MATIASPAEASEKAQAMFGEFSGRVKTAFEKSTKMGEELVDFSKGNVEAVIASAKVAAKAAESLGQEAADYSKKNFESATAAFKSFAAVKSPTELFQLQSEYAKASFDSAVAEASKFSETMMKLAGEIAQPLSNRYALAAEKIKSATNL
jgi:phasin family protein